MSTITVTRNSEGKLVGAGEKNQRAYARFRKRIDDLEPGELFKISHWFPRNPELHGWHFIILTAVFEAQEQWENDDQFRQWVEVGAGFCDWVPGPTGRMIPIVKSIAWDQLDDADFSVHHENVMDFLRSPYCTRFLWGHLSDGAQSEMIETILAECERKRKEIRFQRGKSPT